MNKYEVMELLGEGSFGRVYKARMLSNSNFVALKVICKRGRSPKEVKGLHKECEIQRRLDHPNIIKMLDSFETDNEIVVITEFAHKALKAVLDKETYLPEDRVRPIVWDLVSALYYLHSHRVLHRDLKPQNVLIDANNRAKLCDFGFARNMTTGTHVLTSIKGTPLYMAPELIDEQPYDHNADLWSLGCIIYELLNGGPPFFTTSILNLIRLIRHEQIKWPTFISDTCTSFLKGLLQKNPSKRLNWNEILSHSFVKGHILIREDSAAMPLTRVFSANTLEAKEQQRKHHVTNKEARALGLKSDIGEVKPKLGDKPKKSQDIKNNNLVVQEKMENMSLEEKVEKKTPSLSGGADLSFIEENHPIETEEWIVFLQKSMEEVINGEMTSLTQPNLMNIVVAPLRNSNANPKVLSYVAKLLSIPFVIRGISDATLQQIKKVYLEVKLVPNLVYSSKLLLRLKPEGATNPSASPPNIPSPILENYRDVSELPEEDLQCLECIYMLITHLIHLENEFLSQLCDAIAILNVYSLLGRLLICKNKLQISTDLLAILTRVLRVFPENSELIDKIVSNELNRKKGKGVNFVELLRHSDALLRERACFFLLFTGKYLSSNQMAGLWSDVVRETLEALMYDSMESVRNAADRTVEELRSKEFYKTS